MSKHTSDVERWFRVEVSDHQGQIVAIETDSLSGRDIGESEKFQIERSINHLTGFIGGFPNENDRLREVNSELLTALEPANEILGQLRGYMLSIAHGELGPIDMIEFLRNRVHEIESVEAHARAAIAKATA
jgi:hypothetical protein